MSEIKDRMSEQIAAGQLSPLAELASESKLAAALEDAGRQGVIRDLSDIGGSGCQGTPFTSLNLFQEAGRASVHAWGRTFACVRRLTAGVSSAVLLTVAA